MIQDEKANVKQEICMPLTLNCLAVRCAMHRPRSAAIRNLTERCGVGYAAVRNSGLRVASIFTRFIRLGLLLKETVRDRAAYLRLFCPHLMRGVANCLTRPQRQQAIQFIVHQLLEGTRSGEILIWVSVALAIGNHTIRLGKPRHLRTPLAIVSQSTMQ